MAVREARNKAEFVDKVAETTGFNVEVLSGEQEAMFSYLGSLQFLPVFDHSVLNIDIGGGSTEFAIGSCGKVDFSMSLKLGHITLPQQISADKQAEKVEKMREHVRKVVRKFGLIEKVKTLGFEVAVGSSGTIRAIEKTCCNEFKIDFLKKEPFFKDCELMNWRLSKEKLNSVVESSCKEGKLQKGKRREDSIVAGGILSMEDYDLEANSRFQSLLCIVKEGDKPTVDNEQAPNGGVGNHTTVNQGVRKLREKKPPKTLTDFIRL
ncbi:hypothetical protein V6N13_123612 [Hibiscus sabdariffa]